MLAGSSRVPHIAAGLKMRQRDRIPDGQPCRRTGNGSRHARIYIPPQYPPAPPVDIGVISTHWLKISPYTAI